jgi:hypothetical protein
MTRFFTMGRPIADFMIMAASILAFTNALHLYSARQIDPLVFLFTGGISGLAAIIFGMLLMDRTERKPISLFRTGHA